MATLRTVLVTLLIVVLAALAYVYIGFSDVAADSPHGPVLRWLAQTTRERSIAVRSIARQGAGARFAGTDRRRRQRVRGNVRGMPPRAGSAGQRVPKGDVSDRAAARGRGVRRDDSEAASARRFWIVKHGIKMSAMPAWV